MLELFLGEDPHNGPPLFFFLIDLLSVSLQLHFTYHNGKSLNENGAYQR